MRQHGSVLSVPAGSDRRDQGEPLKPWLSLRRGTRESVTDSSNDSKDKTLSLS